MKIRIKSGPALRAFRPSIGIALLSIFLVACSSDGNDDNPFVNPFQNTDGTTIGETDSTTIGETDSTTIGETDGTTIGETDGTTIGETDSTTIGETDSTTIGETDSTTIGETTIGETDGLSGGEQISCNGSRIWGPIPGLQGTIYVSEANGRPESDVPGCRMIWLHDTTQSCSGLFLVGNEASTSVAGNGNLLFQDPDLNTNTYELLPGTIDINTLEGLPDCPEDGGGSTDTGGNNEGDVIVTGDLTPLSCSGDRVWGPVSGENASDLIYITEANTGDVPQCGLVWIVDTAQNCRNTFTVGDNDVVNVNEEGSLAFQNGSNLLEIGLADVSFNDLIDITECP